MYEAEPVPLSQSSQVHQGAGIHILKISSNFYCLLVWLRGANPENFSSIPLFVQILQPFEYFRVHLFFGFRGFSQFWEAIFRNSQIYKALKDIPLNICLDYYRKQFRT